MAKKYLVTSALPYGNGPIHLGHIAGAYLPADVYCRYRRLRGDDVLYICGNDEHGVPTTLAAEKEGLTNQGLVDKYFNINKKAFEDLGFQFDIYSRTTLPEHAKLSQEFFLKLYNDGHIVQKEIEQLYCENCSRFLPDRYVEGVCPFCGKAGARGDQCENCGKWYEARELVQPQCKICGHTPGLRKTTHWFFELQKFSFALRQWLEGKKGWRDSVKKFALGWLDEGLQPRCITRDLDWGIPVPLEGAAGKVLYVWFDAPIGYVSFTKQYGERVGKPDLWREWWQDKETVLVHFIGKDNIVFHAVVWPAMLMGMQNYVLPADVPANEFLTFGGEKGSKSKGNAVTAPQYLEKFPADLVRYYLTINAPETKDSNFTWEDFARVNNDELADVFGNLFHRIFTFAHKYFEGKMPAGVDAGSGVMGEISATRARLEAAIETFHPRNSLAEVLQLARWGNKFFDEEKPWSTRKTDMARCTGTIAQCLELVAAIAIMLNPYMPEYSGRLWKMLGFEGKIGVEQWKALGRPLLKQGHALAAAEILFKKIEEIPS
jgi:methionyl-tRNA synthetase